MTDRDLVNKAIDRRERARRELEAALKPPIVYSGRRDIAGRPQVRKGQTLVAPSCNYEWGYSGTGPAALAWWLVREATDPETAHEFGYFFKLGFVENWPRSQPWAITDQAIRAWVAQERAANDRRVQAAAA